ncbi:MAG: ferritin-like domain-containing protein [Thermomicrobiales bacterium]|nr:ferritin-like domain-containing protein [Thermomicrobiales bacterium]
MRPLHTLLETEIHAERRRLSRRGLLTTSAKLAGGAALALSIGFGPSPVSIRRLASAQAMTSMDILNYALTLEHLEYAFYRDGVGLFTFGEDSRGASIDTNLAAIRDHEMAHVEALTQAITDLGGEPVAEATYDFGDAYTNPAAFLATAMALENTGVSAYDGAGQYIDDPDLLTAAGSIAAVEARHASYLNLLNGEIPFPDAFEKPLPQEKVLAIAGPFIKM